MDFYNFWAKFPKNNSTVQATPLGALDSRLEALAMTLATAIRTNCKYYCAERNTSSQSEPNVFPIKSKVPYMGHALYVTR